MIKKAKKSGYEKDKVFVTFYENLGDVNIQADEVVIPTYVSFVEKKVILIDLRCTVLMLPLICCMLILQTYGFLQSSSQSSLLSYICRFIYTKNIYVPSEEKEFIEKESGIIL